MNTYIVRQINEFTIVKFKDDNQREETEHIRDDGTNVIHIYNDTDREITKTVRKHVADELVVTSKAKAKSVAAHFLDNIRNDIYCRFEDDVTSNAGNPEELYFADQKDVPRLYTIYQRLRENIGEWDCNMLQDRFGFSIDSEGKNPYIDRSLSKYSIERILEDNPNFIPDEELTEDILDKCYDLYRFGKRKERPLKVKKHSKYDRKRMHTKKREVQFDFDLNEDVLLNMKDKLDTAWDNYMDSMQVFDTNLEGKEGKACKYVLTNKYYVSTGEYTHRQEHVSWNESGKAHRSWIEVLVVSPTKHSDVDDYEYDMWLKDEKAQAEAQDMKEREAEMRLFASESGHNNMVMNADGSFETWREF